MRTLLPYQLLGPICGMPLQVVLPPDARPFRDAIVYGAVIVMLIWRPNGLFASKAAKQRV